MRNKIVNNLQGKKVLLFFILSNIVYAFMLLVTIPKVMSYSNELKILDMLPTGYDLKYINTLFEALGVEGRAVYLYSQLPVDFIYPFLFAVSNCLLLAYFLKKLSKEKSKLFYFCYLPLIGGLADYLENIGIITLLKSYPNISESMAQITASFSMLKSTTTTLYFIVLLIVLLIVFGKFLKKKMFC